jgi:hypothetical protein
MIKYHDARRVLYNQLFPEDSIAQQFYNELEAWFESDRRAGREWDDLLAIALGSAPPHQVPAITERIHARLHMGVPDFVLPLFTKPLVRRLKTDGLARESFRSALADPATIDVSTPIFARAFDPISAGHPEHLPMQRIYLFSLALKQAGALDP